MNLLVLKSIAWNEEDKKFYSPSHTDFEWPKGIIIRKCPHQLWMHCNENDTISPECTCGIYASTHLEAVDEYAHYPNSIIVLLNLYGTVEIWTGPNDLPGTYITRSWGAKMVGLASNDTMEQLLRKQGGQVAIIAASYYGVQVYPWTLAQGMIKLTWEGIAEIAPYPDKLPEEIRG